MRRIRSAFLDLWLLWSGAAVFGTSFAAHSFAAANLTDSNAFERAISQVQPGRTVDLPAGVFVITEPIRLPSGARLIGAGQDKTLIHYAGPKPGAMISLQDCRALEWKECTVGGNSENELRPAESFGEPAPVAAFRAPAKGRVGEPIRFVSDSRAAQGRIAAVLWDFNDGAPVSEANPTHLYTQPGEYQVTPIVWDESGRAARAEQRLALTAAITPTPSPLPNPPYPHSPAIESIAWHWETHTTAAPGSDLWPVTWGPDDHLYAAWGDGGGFGGSDSDGRVAMGFARIEGRPENWRGINVNGGKNPERPASFPGKGKTTGLALVDGVLYSTVNLQDGTWPDVNHVLAWSTNYGATWTKAGWLFAKGTGNFQPAKFLTFGRDYTGVPTALAGHVYLYGPKQSADQGSGNRLYLARAPRTRLQEKGAYEFFQQTDDAGAPVWVAEITRARPVFIDPNGVTPGSVVYDPGLKRFLLTCFHVGPGQLGVFDAPNPWGPWTTVGYNEDWGRMGREGEGLTCGFPQKWMSADGLTLWAIFSVYGDGAKKGINAHDKFNLVKATLQPFANSRQTRISIVDGRWHINGEVTYHRTKAEGLLLNVRMVNATFEDLKRPDFDAQGNTDGFIRQIPDYIAHGVRAFTLNLQGGMPGYEGAVNSAFQADGSLRDSYMARVRQVIEACDRQGAAVILGCFYQRQDQLVRDEAAVRAGVVHVAQWIQAYRFRNVVLEIANEFGHGGFNHRILRQPDGQVELLRLAKQTAPELLVSTSGLGDGTQKESVARASDFLLIHFNSTSLADIPQRIAALKEFGKPIVCNEDDKAGQRGAEAAELCVSNGASWGLMLQDLNQHFPFTFRGAADDPVVYAALKEISSAQPAASEPAEPYYPPPESAGGWRTLDDPEDIRRFAGADPSKLSALREWLLHSDDRDFAAVLIRRGYIVLQVERGNSAKTDSRRVASVSKAICATVLAIASEQSQHGLTSRKMSFDDPAFDFIPWARPLSDPRKASITVKQLLNHTSGICPEATGAPNDGTWEYILGHTGDERTAKLAFAPGTSCGYSTHALAHAALVCESVTGMPYDQFAVQALFKPIGIEHWWFQYYEGGEKYGRHPSHGLGMPARDLARIAYCMLRDGRWKDQQVIPGWFVDQTAAPTHDVKTPELRWKLNPQVFSHGWELPSRHWPQSGRSGEGIPVDAREKPGSGGQLIAFVPSLDLVVTRQTGSSGDWAFEEFLRRACATVLIQRK